ncbi:MAG: hypothetical protein WCF93_05540 [Candidatus Moraniibacteriota bacterium]
MTLITPKYLTTEIAERAILTAVNAVMGETSPLKEWKKQQDLHIVVLVPGVEAHGYLNHKLKPMYLLEKSYNKEKWERNFQRIAECIALQIWEDRNSDQHGPIPHLLFSNDTPWWGGVKRDGLVVAAAGLKPLVCKLISGIVADTMIALAQDAFANDENRSNPDFID